MNTDNQEDPSQVDLNNVIHTLKDLDLAKAQLIGDYQHVLEERKFAEDKMVKLREQLTETSSQFIKRQELNNALKLKSSSATARVESLEEHCKLLQLKITNLQDELRREKQQQLDDLVNFEAQMLELKELFIKAAKYYTAKSLSEEVENTKAKTLAYQAQQSEMDSKLKEVEKECENLALAPAKLRSENESVPIEQQTLILELLSREQEALECEVESLRLQKLKQLENLKSPPQV